MRGVRVGADENARALLVDSNYRVIAASDGVGLLTEHIALRRDGNAHGFYRDAAGKLIAFHATPGYETYRGLGWYGVIMQPDTAAAK